MEVLMKKFSFFNIFLSGVLFLTPFFSMTIDQRVALKVAQSGKVPHKVIASKLAPKPTPKPVVVPAKPASAQPKSLTAQSPAVQVAVSDPNNAQNSVPWTGKGSYAASAFEAASDVARIGQTVDSLIGAFGGSPPYGEITSRLYRLIMPGASYLSLGVVKTGINFAWAAAADKEDLIGNHLVKPLATGFMVKTLFALGGLMLPATMPATWIPWLLVGGLKMAFGALVVNGTGPAVTYGMEAFAHSHNEKIWNAGNAQLFKERQAALARGDMTTYNQKNQAMKTGMSNRFCHSCQEHMMKCEFDKVCCVIPYVHNDKLVLCDKGTGISVEPVTRDGQQIFVNKEKQFEQEDPSQIMIASSPIYAS
jgi:hypothetical protein